MMGKNLVHPNSKAWATPAAVSYAVQGGEKMAKERGYQLETGPLFYLMESC
jgi:hypothetical protein